MNLMEQKGNLYKVNQANQVLLTKNLSLMNLKNNLLFPCLHNKWQQTLQKFCLMVPFFYFIFIIFIIIIIIIIIIVLQKYEYLKLFEHSKILIIFDTKNSNSWCWFFVQSFHLFFLPSFLFPLFFFRGEKLFILEFLFSPDFLLIFFFLWKMKNEKWKMSNHLHSIKKLWPLPHFQYFWFIFSLIFKLFLHRYINSYHY